MPTDDAPAVQEFPFPWPNEASGYALFPPELENDELVFFHGTPKKNLDPIRREGFKRSDSLPSVSYARKSSMSLDHVVRKRHEWNEPEAVVFVVRFDNTDDPALVHNPSDIHVYKPELQPKILGYCIVPANYEHR
jgi:hypothetical protein